MLIRFKRSWELPEAAATPEGVYLDRRRFLQGLAAGPMLAGAAAALAPFGDAAAADADPSAGLYPLKRNEAFKVERAITDEKLSTTYNNFYEFGTHKQIWKAAQKLPVRPWTVTLDGMVEKEQTIDIDALLKQMPLEERVYRHRCVEAWSMIVPWGGFPLKALVELARPTAGAKYVVMQTFNDKSVAPGLKQFWYPWPYVDGLTMAEATHDLSFIATGLYGKPIPKQNGAPLRLAVPWKYGFKSVKSIVRFTFTDQRPKSFWEVVQGAEYGFWANVNPEVAHPRWSQATEKPLGSEERIPTLLYNGYAEQVAGLYKDLQGEKLFI
ncbi:MAG: protein-methionine-sulfoxide reductase catalytic subunit MsrP [Rhodospirillaceae bacterium]